MREGQRSTEGEAWGILNPYGDLWSHKTFATADEAMAYAKDFWRPLRSGQGMARGFKPVRVTVRLATIAETDHAQ